MQKQREFRPVDVSDAAKMSASEAIEYHYDNDTRFFSLWLDPTLSYSAARWREPLAAEPFTDELAAAQDAKLRYHLDAVALPEGGALIDVGCGWGAVLHRAVSEYRASRAVGLTLSRDQHAYVTEKNWPGVEVILHDVYRYESGSPFDGAISIGAFEHFARPEMDRTAKVAVYREFFERMHSLLRRGARFSLQTIVWDAVTYDTARQNLLETVFPQSNLPFVEEVVAGSQDTFRLMYLENDPLQYELTLAAWIDNLRAHRDTIVSEWGPGKFEFFESYLRSSRLGFARRKISLARFVLVRR